MELMVGSIQDKCMRDDLKDSHASAPAHAHRHPPLEGDLQVQVALHPVLILHLEFGRPDVQHVIL